MPCSHRRALLFFHHILSSKKKAIIREEARKLRVSGVCKVGHPGVLVVQGTDINLQDYIAKIKRLRWQSCAVNLNEPLDENALSASFGDRVRELQEMKELGHEMERAGPGWRDWWRKGMGFRGNVSTD